MINEHMLTKVIKIKCFLSPSIFFLVRPFAFFRNIWPLKRTSVLVLCQVNRWIYSRESRMFIDIIISSLVTMQQFLKYNSSVIYASLQTRALLITSPHLAGDQLYLWVCLSG